MQLICPHIELRMSISQKFIYGLENDELFEQASCRMLYSIDANVGGLRGLWLTGVGEDWFLDNRTCKCYLWQTSYKVVSRLISFEPSVIWISHYLSCSRTLSSYTEMELELLIFLFAKGKATLVFISISSKRTSNFYKSQQAEGGGKKWVKKKIMSLQC